MKTKQKVWRDRLIPGLSITGLVMLMRFLGAFQTLEWRAFDLSLRQRPPEATDSRITIIELTEEDVQNELGYPISDEALAKLLQTLQTYQPRTIGVDIFRDIPVGEGQQVLASVFKNNSNIVGISRIEDPIVKAHPSLSKEQVGFADVIVDNDGYLRRSLLGSADLEDNYHLAFTIQLAKQYLANDKITLDNGIKDPETMRFGDKEILRLQPYTGGYNRVNSNGNQTLINFRSGQTPFQTLSYAQVISGSVPPELLQDRVILIGYTAESVKDFVSSAAIASDNPSLIPGVYIQAHAVSQILSAIYDNRPFLASLPEFIEYLLIASSGLMGAALALWQRRLFLHWGLTLAIGTSWLLVCYGLAVASWWLPLVPVAIAFGLNAVGLYPLYQTQAQLAAQIKERKHLINWTYNTIHNGPVQILSNVLSEWPATASPPTATRSKLESLNRELRDIYETMRQEMLLANGTLIMTGQRTVDLELPLDAVLYETYQCTLERQRSFFEKVIQITTFEPMPDSRLTLAKKRELARFLEEALINVYKYAKTATRLSIACRQEDSFNVIRVTDNGKGASSIEREPVLLNIGSKIQRLTAEHEARSEYGTRQAARLAKQLGGQFKREDIQPHGVCCELRWPLQSPTVGRWFKQSTSDKAIK